MYRVTIKESAIAQAGAVREFVDEHGHEPRFASREAADAFVRSLGDGDLGVRLQAAAASDPTTADAYLVRDGQCNEWEPVESDTPGVTFPVGGNVYGALGVALVYLGGTPSPALTRWVADVHDSSGEARLGNIQREPGLPSDVPDDIAWRPDLGFDIVQPTAGAVERYFAEVKAGRASFQRSQRADMQRVANAYGVVKVRVDLAELPERYTVRIDEVAPDGWPA